MNGPFNSLERSKYTGIIIFSSQVKTEVRYSVAQNFRLKMFALDFAEAWKTN